jgi:D-amino-acid oxidase
MKIIVIGCGIIGLSTAYVLQSEGFEVEIIAKDLPENTVSNVAAAVWFPFWAEPRERVMNWCKTSHIFYQNLQENGWQGIETLPLQILTNDNLTRPDWLDGFPNTHQTKLVTATEKVLPKGYNFAHEMDIFIIETPIFTPFLMKKFLAKGGKITEQTITDFEGFMNNNQNKIVINCTGLAAKELVNDTELFPIQGQIVKIEKQKNVNRAVFDDGEHNAVAYIIPRTDAVILGGTAVANNYSEIPDLNTQNDIIRRCQNIEPNLATPTVLASIVGFRPGRKTVRVERENNRNLIHNYGHGGSGYTINWGCALEVLDLVRNFDGLYF